MRIEDQDAVIPVVEEALAVSTRTIQTDHVRVRTIVEDKPTEAVARLARETLTVERRSVEREVLTAPAPYEDGDLLIIPVVEERLVVEKRLFVIEEIVVRRDSHVEDVRIPTTVKTMRAVIEQDSASSK